MSRSWQITFIDFDDIQNPLLGAGSAIATFEMCKRFVKKGHSVEVISSKFPGSKDGYHDGILYTHIGVSSKYLRLNNIAFFFALPLRVRKIRADIIVESFAAPISTLFSPLFTKIPVIAFSDIFNAEEFSKKYHLPFHWIEHFGCRFYRYMIALTESMRQKMMKYNPTIRAEVIPYGVDEIYMHNKTNDGLYALCLSRIDIYQKGFDLLLDAISKSVKKLNITIIIAGIGNNKEIKKLNTLIKKMQLENTVMYVGKVSGQKKLDLISGARFGICASRFETFGISVLEFLASAKPIVCFNIDGLQWLPENTALKAEPFSETSLSKVLVQMSEQNNLRQKYSVNARHFAADFSWDKIVMKYEDFFDEILRLEKRHA
ncbi:glycosyltransferase family 4 protein [Candidatus Parcubacteria bacterium]|nr:glycosyltransferase family 4 protein [Candidatus Parcubacteria bacterium]